MGRSFCMFLLPLKWMLSKSRVCCLHPIPELLLGLLLLKCLPFPVEWSLCLTLARMTDPIETETFQYWTLCLSAGHLSHSNSHLAQQQQWCQLFYPLSEQNRKEVFPTSIQSLTSPLQTTLLSYKFKPLLVTNYVRNFSPWTSQRTASIPLNRAIC